MIKED